MTRRVRIGGVHVGGGEPVVVQSMCATRTIDIDATVAQVHQLVEARAGIVRIALDSEKEVAALKEIRAQTRGITLSVDLQENYRVAEGVAPYVDKIRYNPGHLHHIASAGTFGVPPGEHRDRDFVFALVFLENSGSPFTNFLLHFHRVASASGILPSSANFLARCQRPAQSFWEKTH